MILPLNWAKSSTAYWLIIIIICDPGTKAVISKHRYICSNRQQYIVWVKIIHFSFMPKIIRILRSCSMKIFSKFPTVNISKLNFWLVICIAKNFIWTTLKMIFSIFRFFCTLRFQIYKYCPIITNHTSMERWFIQLQMFKKWLLWLVLWSMVTFVYESEWSRTSLLDVFTHSVLRLSRSGTRAVSWTWLSSSVFLYHRLCPSSRASRVSRRVQLRTGGERGPPDALLHPRPVLPRLLHRGDSQTQLSERRSAVRRHWRAAEDGAAGSVSGSGGGRLSERGSVLHRARGREHAGGRLLQDGRSDGPLGALTLAVQGEEVRSTWTVRSTTASPSAESQTHSPSSPAPASFCIGNAGGTRLQRFVECHCFS